MEGSTSRALFTQAPGMAGGHFLSYGRGVWRQRPSLGLLHSGGFFYFIFFFFSVLYGQVWGKARIALARDYYVPMGGGATTRQGKIRGTGNAADTSSCDIHQPDLPSDSPYTHTCVSLYLCAHICIMYMQACGGHRQPWVWVFFFF